MRNLNLPNLLTLSRLALAPFVVRAIIIGQYRQALALLAVAGITDGLDGFLARRLHAITRFGAYIDPVADKSLLSAVWISLGVSSLAPWWLVALIFGRDAMILLLVGSALLFTRHREFPPSIWGKLSTALQIVTALVVIVAQALPGPAWRPEPLFWVAGAATAWSGLHYLGRAVVTARGLRSRNDDPACGAGGFACRPASAPSLGQAKPPAPPPEAPPD
jgi:cardiolipin synthase